MTSASSVDACSLADLTKEAEVFWKKDLTEINREHLNILLNTFNEIHSKYEKFKKTCYSKLSKENYDFYESVFVIALLKLSTSISDKTISESVDDRARYVIKYVISMFTDDEKNFVREFEKFNALDPNVVSPDLLANYIISRREGIYELVKEAVDKQYIYFNRLIESWSGRYKLSNAVRRGFLILYQARFKNIVDAIKKLIDQNPTLIKKLFSDYEESLLSSAKIREQFEQKIREVFEEKLKSMSDHIEKLEKERNDLIKRLEEFSRIISTAESKRISAEAELSKLHEEFQNLKNRYDMMLKAWEENLKEIDLLKRRIEEKEKELRKVIEKEKENEVVRVALENEIARLNQLVKYYETKIREYESEKNNLLMQIRKLEQKLSIIERGKTESRLITAEEAALFEIKFIGKIKGKLKNLPIKIITPDGNEVFVDKWEDVKETYDESVKHNTKLPRNTRILYTSKIKRLFGETRIINVLVAYIVDLEDLKEYGTTSKQASLEDIQKVLNDAPKAAPNEKMFTIIGIASPTGWSEKAISYVSQLFIEDMVVLLVDPVENLVYHPEVRGSESWVEIFIGETILEEEHRIEKTIEKMCADAIGKSPSAPVFLYSKLLKELSNVSYLSLNRVLRKLVDRGVIKIEKGEKDTRIICIVEIR